MSVCPAPGPPRRRSPPSPAPEPPSASLFIPVELLSATARSPTLPHATISHPHARRLLPHILESLLAPPQIEAATDGSSPFQPLAAAAPSAAAVAPIFTVDYKYVSRFIAYDLCAVDEALKDANWFPLEDDRKERTIPITIEVKIKVKVFIIPDLKLKQLSGSFLASSLENCTRRQ
ncbi:hypothetical protein GUJ93_ZPchr0008g11843 [Zizania palustris]|uniref:Uncharacterized protein n=1 Tax=Zizania palustris TaxID=103762 RepID=A0A8J5RH26_ZIZPA|nr:hypothetical protein GUJ93_ZPchr0008g11843 [Zizania palustris]